MTDIPLRSFIQVLIQHDEQRPGEWKEGKVEVKVSSSPPRPLPSCIASPRAICIYAVLWSFPHPILSLELASLFLHPNTLPFFTPFSDGIVNANTMFLFIVKERL